jgi:hypothetical protein
MNPASQFDVNGEHMREDVGLVASVFVILTELMTDQVREMM